MKADIAPVIIRAVALSATPSGRHRGPMYMMPAGQEVRAQCGPAKKCRPVKKCGPAKVLG